MTVDREKLGAKAMRYLLEPMSRMHEETDHQVLAIVTPPPNPEGAAVVLTTVTNVAEVEDMLRQAIISHLRALGRNVRVVVEDISAPGCPACGHQRHSAGICSASDCGCTVVMRL